MMFFYLAVRFYLIVRFCLAVIFRLSSFQMLFCANLHRLFPHLFKMGKHMAHPSIRHQHFSVFIPHLFTLLFLDF